MLAAAFQIAAFSASSQEGGLVPLVVRCCVEEVERRGMDEVGVYRVSGGALDIGTLKAAFDTSKAASLSLRAHVGARLEARRDFGPDLRPSSALRPP